MWFWIIVIAVVIGATIAYLNSGNKEDAIEGALAGGCLAMGCLSRLAIAAIAIIVILWLFSVIF